MKKEINLEERKSLQLAMLKEIDAFCKKNGLRYSLAFGTLLGAIRHKGFIPWDDDLDIMMPVEDIIKFKAIFNYDKLKFCDVDTEKYYDLDFPRISHKRTYKIEEKQPVAAASTYKNGFMFRTAESFLNNLSKKNTSNVDLSQYKSGVKVFHKKFGEGIINQVEPEGEDLNVDINFEKVGHKRLMAKFANLEII